MPYADLHLGPNIRLFGQLIEAGAFGMEPSPSPVDETGADVLQAFAQLRFRRDTETLMLQGGRHLGWSPMRGVNIEAAYSVFDPGLFIEETGPAKTVRFVGAEIQLRF